MRGAVSKRIRRAVRTEIINPRKFKKAYKKAKAEYQRKNRLERADGKHTVS